MTLQTRRIALFALAAAAAGAFPAFASDRLEKSFDLAPGGRFHLKTAVGRVRITAHSGKGAHLLVTSHGRDLDDILSFQFDETPGSVAVTARSRHAIFFSNSGSVEFEVELPAETAIDIDTAGGPIEASGLRAPAKLETSGGPIRVQDLEATLHAHTSGGSIRLQDIRGEARVDTSGGDIDAVRLGGSLHGETSGGSIHLEQVSGDVDVHTSGGGIRVREAGGRLVAETSGGSIDASFAKGNSRGGSLESSGGGITVAIDPTIGLTIDAEGSHVHTDLPLRVQGEITRGSLHGSLGSGGEKLKLRTSGGGIRIQGI